MEVDFHISIIIRQKLKDSLKKKKREKEWTTVNKSNGFHPVEYAAITVI